MDAEIDFSKYYTLRGAAKFCGVSASAVRNWIHTSRIKATKAGSQYMIHEDELIKVQTERKLDETEYTEATESV